MHCIPFAHACHRTDFQDASRWLVNQAVAQAANPGAICPEAHSQHYPGQGAGMEGFCRLLWGWAPLVAGGVAPEQSVFFREGLIAGTDPCHAGFWGEPVDYDQRFVEHASIATALLLARERLFDPLDDGARKNVIAWLRRINGAEVVPNNWRMFRVLANAAIRHVGESPDFERLESDLAAIDGYFLGNGWYGDGANGARDYYNPMAFHFYGLLLTRLAPDLLGGRAPVFIERARRFAQDFRHWFADDGAALPYGRSLTYRFAQGAFWGALAYAGVEALPWGEIKGLWMRHFRWWCGRPVLSHAQTLTVGYGYPNLVMAEDYNGPGAPGWALKFFLPIALPEDHPFWQAEETVGDRPVLSIQPEPGMILRRDVVTGQVVASCGGHAAEWLSLAGEKYAKFAYSTKAGFCVSHGNDIGLDGMLALSDDGIHWRIRRKGSDIRIENESIISRWSPFPDVSIETTLTLEQGPEGIVQLRTHRIVSGRKLWTREGGFALNTTHVRLMGDALKRPPFCTIEETSIVLRHGDDVSGIAGLSGTRVAASTVDIPNINLLHPRVRVPYLAGELEPGTSELGCRVWMR
ncbi:MAG: hypothetical protein K0R17_2000 [Rariglobus sp.]|jgi:hypothetical protein|nr:hypothetical protein [Rariglobus sp.]